MEIVMRKVSELTPYDKNAKKHDAKQIANVAQSIQEMGWKQPLVVDANGVVIVGHCRLLAAKKLKQKEVPCVVADDLTDEQIRKYRILDNKLAESPWDLDLLADDMADLSFDGYEIDFHELDALTGGGATTNDIIEDDFDVTPPEEPKAKLGDVYQLGRHRLMCGDSTSITDVEKLTAGRLIDLVVTDPPYNMGYEGAGKSKDRKSKRILNDKMPESEFEDFLSAIYNNYFCSMADGASIYVFYKELGTGVFITAMNKSGLTYKQELIWVKNQIVLGGSKYQSMYEPFLMGCKGSIKTWNGARKQRSVIESIDLMDEESLRQTIRDLLSEEDVDVIRERKQLVNDLHPTMKPVRLIAKLILNSSNAGNAVMDLFGGSGTTLIAAEQTNRSAYLMELDPKYVDVIIARWEQFTGEKAVLLNAAS